MDRQVEFQKLLKSLMGTAASFPDVFYQPPGDQVLTYPCIIYDRSTGQTMHANNGMYSHLVFKLGTNQHGKVMLVSKR